MSDVIDIKRFQKRRKAENFKSAEEMTREAVSSLLHTLSDRNFPIDGSHFQQDLALAFKFIHAAISKHYGIDNPFYEAIDKFKKDVKW